MTHPHKGHRFLLDVFERCGEALGVRLVLIGGAGSIDEEVTRRADQLAGLVSKLGRVSDSDRDGLISAAAAVVFPSEYEGFGAPLIEAMALGTPVISSDRACLPEVVGSAGIVVPLDIDSWREAIGDVDRRRAELVTAGRKRVRDFTVEVSGSALATAYRSLLDVDGVGS
jgi:glycosyltransferase involved in cell wall biosynthesis